VAERDAIRDAIVELLIAEDTLAGARVTGSRSRKIWDGALPAIGVYTPRETFAIHTAAPRVYKVTTTVEVDIYAEETAQNNPDKVLDEIERGVFRAMSRDVTLGLGDLEIVPTAFAAQFGSGTKRPLGGSTSTFEAVHFREAPEGELGEMGRFETAHVEIDLPPADGIAESVDDIEIES